jgi:hypothetical protein
MSVSQVQPGSPLDADTLTALQHAVASLPAGEVDEAARVPELALLAAVPEAAKAFPTVRDSAVRAELAARGIRSEPRGRAPEATGRAHTAWSVIALVIALVAPALIMSGRTGSSALDAASGALPSGIGMVVALAILLILEPKRTAGTLYRGGSIPGGTFILFAVLWLAAAAISFVGGALETAGGEGAVGLALQLASAVGAGALAVVATRHDRARPQVTGGRSVPTGPEVPAELAADPRFRAGLERRLADWRRHTETVLSTTERARVRAAELEVARMLAARADDAPA